MQQQEPGDDGNMGKFQTSPGRRPQLRHISEDSCSGSLFHENREGVMRILDAASRIPDFLRAPAATTSEKVEK